MGGVEDGDVSGGRGLVGDVVLAGGDARVDAEEGLRVAVGVAGRGRVPRGGDGREIGVVDLENVEEGGILNGDVGGGVGGDMVLLFDGAEECGRPGENIVAEGFENVDAGEAGREGDEGIVVVGGWFGVAVAANDVDGVVVGRGEDVEEFRVDFEDGRVGLRVRDGVLERDGGGGVVVGAVEEIEDRGIVGGEMAV